MFNKNPGFQAYIEFNTPGRFYKLYFWRPILDYEKERYQILKSPEIIESTSGYELPPDCGISLGGTEVQTLMDQLWSKGVRPTEGHGSTGQIAAVENHLAAITTTHDRLLTLIEKSWGKP